jgi:hypothetical protein
MKKKNIILPFVFAYLNITLKVKLTSENCAVAMMTTTSQSYSCLQQTIIHFDFNFVTSMDERPEFTFVANRWQKNLFVPISKHKCEI